MNKAYLPRWLWFVLPILAITLPFQFLNHTGFCYQETQYIGERELLDRFLFGEQAESMSEDEKISALKQRNGAEYPECCRIEDHPSWWTRSYAAFQSTIGNYRYGLVYLHPLSPEETQQNNNYPYYSRYVSLNACGGKPYPGPGITTSEKEYASKIEQNHKYWEAGQ